MGRTVHRVGIGSDVHRVAAGGPLILGGVRIDAEVHLDGHSDADVVLHAITDALLGAMGAGDIGEHFPDTDPSNRGRCSEDFLNAANALCRDGGWAIDNLDIIVQSEHVRLSAHKPLMRKHIAAILGVDADRVNVKAKTAEAVGAIGRGEAIAAWAVVSLSSE